MKVTIKARGYEGIKGEVASSSDHGAWVVIFRKGIDLAERVIYFTWSALKEIKVKETKMRDGEVRGGKIVIGDVCGTLGVVVGIEPVDGKDVKLYFRRVTPKGNIGVPNFPLYQGVSDPIVKTGHIKVPARYTIKEA